MSAEDTTMSVGDFLAKVFEEKPEESCLRLEGNVTIDWTSSKHWGVMSNQHWIEIFAGGKSVFADSFGQDCLNEEDKTKILTALQQLFPNESQNVASLQGHIEW